MAYKITDDCIKCGSCESECPVSAISEGDDKYVIDANECPDLVSAMYCCKKIPGSSPVELDKSPERKVPIHLQAGLTPQIPSALTYLVWGLFERWYSGVRNGNAGAGTFSV